jgi:O-antigen ligase
MSIGFFRNPEASDIGAPDTTRLLYWVLVLFSLVPLCVVLPMAPLKVGIALLAAWVAMIWLVIIFVRGQLHYVALLWVAVYPYCYYFFSYPRERSIFTIDRAFIVLLVIQMFVVSPRTVMAPLTRDVRISAYFWGLYLLVCFLSLLGHSPSEALNSYRLLIDGMLMPALFGLYAIRYFPLLKELQKLHVCACILGIGLCITSLIELTTGIDLFPWVGAEAEFTETHLRRADGPFEQPVVLSTVATLAFFLIIYLWRLIPQRTSPWRVLLHKAGAVASFTAAMVPLNRGLVLALAPIAIIDAWSRDRLISRRTWAAFFGVVLVAAFAAKLLDPQLYDDRVANRDNLYQRIAQDRETLGVVREYPFFGVGFALYHDVTSREPRFLTRWKGLQSMNVPHNAFMTVLSEEGILGLLFYLFAQLFLIRAMWKIRKAYPPGWLAFLYCLLAYALIGLDFATAYFSDINLFYIFTLGILFQLQTRIVHEQELAVPTRTNRNLQFL